jgi:hypothetical protein
MNRLIKLNDYRKRWWDSCEAETKSQIGVVNDKSQLRMLCLLGFSDYSLPPEHYICMIFHIYLYTHTVYIYIYTEYYNIYIYISTYTHYIYNGIYPIYNIYRLYIIHGKTMLTSTRWCRMWSSCHSICDGQPGNRQEIVKKG